MLQIRAASIMHCAFITALSEGDASFFKFRQRHQVTATHYFLSKIVQFSLVSVLSVSLCVHSSTVLYCVFYGLLPDSNN